ncbi:MAG: hypothetical protein ACLPN6_03950 [Streptosporangiaceae bacterium]
MLAPQGPSRGPGTGRAARCRPLVRAAAFGIAAANRARSRYTWDRIGREAMTAYDRSLARPAA